MPDNDTATPSSAPEPSPPPATNAVGEAVDLSVLKSLSFGPDWSATPSTASLARKMGGRGEGKSGGDRPRGFGGFDNGGPPRRDRRPSRPSTPSAFAPGQPPAGENGGAASAHPPSAMGEASRMPFRGPGGQRPPRRDGFGRDDRRFSPPPFQPTHEVLFYPDDAAFRALLKAIRTSCRTYELFEVARLILQKPERFVVVIKPLPHGDGPLPLIYISQPDLLPFESEEEAVSHVFEKHLDKFLDVEVVEVEPPKGNFIGVSRCGLTGELLGPPNYHLYQQLLREHHARRLARTPFERFTARVELVKEPEHLAAWLEKMKKSTRYKLKTPLEGAPEFFESLDAARQFLLGKSKDAIVRGLDTGRYSGRSLEQFPPGNIRHSVEALLALQRRFPLDTANNLRGRLRRMKFNLYKKGSKGVSYICAVRRRFRDPQTVLADHVQKLITFIEQHPLTPASRLPHEFLGLPLPAEKKPAEPVAPVAIAPTPGTPASADAEPTTEAVSPPVEKSAPAVETQNSKPETLFTPEQTQQFRDLVINLRWLVMEGYVVEYGDGRLFAPPPLPAPKAKAANEGEVPAEAEAPSSPDEEIIEDTAPSSDGDSNGVTDDVGEAEFTDVLDTPAAAEAAAPSEAPPSDPPASAV